jgi:toluene monooxygenase system protein A
MGALQYMNLAPGEIGDDAHQYAWVAAYRDKRYPKKAA